MTTSDVISTLSLLISLASVWYMWRTFRVATIPVATIWMDGNNVYINNHSPSIALIDVCVKVKIVISERYFIVRNRRSHMFFTVKIGSITPNEIWGYTPSSGKTGSMGEPLNDKIEEFLAKPSIGILDAINTNKPLHADYRVLKDKPFIMRVEARYKSAIFGSRYHTLRQEYLITPECSGSGAILTKLTTAQVNKSR